MAKHTSPIFAGFCGSIDRQLLFRQVAGETIVSKFPDRSEVIYTEKQRQKQRKFSDAVFFARTIIANHELKKIYSVKATLHNYRSAWNVAIAEYMNEEPLTLKPKTERFDKHIINESLERNVPQTLIKRIPVSYQNSGIMTSQSPGRILSGGRRGQKDRIRGFSDHVIDKKRATPHKSTQNTAIVK